MDPEVIPTAQAQSLLAASDVVGEQQHGGTRKVVCRHREYGTSATLYFTSGSTEALAVFHGAEPEPEKQAGPRQNATEPRHRLVAALNYTPSSARSRPDLLAGIKALLAQRD